MTASAATRGTPPSPALAARRRGRSDVSGPPGKTALGALAAKWLGPMVAFWVFSGGFVLLEPSPYELVFLLVLPFALLGGVGLHRKTQPLLYLMIVFTPFALIGAFQVRYNTIPSSMIYVIVTVFLWFTSYFAANYIADDPRRRLAGMMRAYTAVAVLITILGTLAYLRAIPGADILLRYDRVKATFQDPNVFAPFLIIPAAFALQSALMGRGKRAFMGALIFAILFVGVFVSFSRAAWGYILFTSAFVFVACFLLEANLRDRTRMVVLAIIGVLVLVMALVALLSIDSVRELFLQRFSLSQNYDSGSTGRFARQAYAFELAISNPWGIGPLEFGFMRIMEEPHNTYVKVLLTYGWGGGLAYFALVWMTLKVGLGALMRPSANRLLMIPLVANFIPLIIESAIIDTDHWRHFFLLVGMIWGVWAGYGRTDRQQESRQGRLI